MDLAQFARNGKFLMLAIDQRSSFRRMLSPTSPETVTSEQMIKAKGEIINTLYDSFSSLLIDPKYGLPADKNKTKPYLLCIEKSGYNEKNGERFTELEYSVEDLKSMGPSGIKLNLYFNPSTPQFSRQIDLAKNVRRACNKNQLPLFLEIVTYGEGSVIDSVKAFLKENLVPDVFKLEYPGSAESCQEVTKLAGSVPWILLSGGGEYELFKENLKTAVFNGASGFLAGRSIWQEYGRCQSEDDKKNYLTNVVLKRFEEISRIVMKDAHLA